MCKHGSKSQKYINNHSKNFKIAIKNWIYFNETRTEFNLGQNFNAKKSQQIADKYKGAFKNAKKFLNYESQNLV